LEEVKTLIENAQSLRLKAFLTVAFLTGMRTGEQLALTWEDILQNAFLKMFKNTTWNF
ncbi:hypothetical protein DB721_02815, partial [Helicobacter pylori]